MKWLEIRRKREILKEVDFFLQIYKNEKQNWTSLISKFTGNDSFKLILLMPQNEHEQNQDVFPEFLKNSFVMLL